MMNLVVANDYARKEDAWIILGDVYPNFESRHPNQNDYKRKLFDKACIICADTDGLIEGMVAFYCNDTVGKVAYISQIAVKSSARGKGLGGALLEKCEKVSRKNGMDYLRLEVRNENKRAIRFYEYHGLRFEKKASENSIYMIKSL